MSKIVLCVDDSATMQMVADITFRGTDFQYVGAKSHDEGLDKARANRPAVVLADAQMSGKTGYDLCMAIKSDPKLADVPVVMLVGNGAAYDAAAGAKSGADANLPKPWDTQTMLEKVTEIVSKSTGGVAKPGSGVAAAAAAPAPKPAPTPVPTATPPGNAANQPPRSATVIGMPTIKMPAGVAPTVAPVTAPGKAPAPATTAPAVAAGAAVASAPARAPVAAPPPPAAVGGMNRSPMVSGSPTKRSALVERTLQKMASRLAEATGLEPGSPELMALLKLSAEVVERVVWEVVPDLAEQIIRENLQELTSRRSS